MLSIDFAPITDRLSVGSYPQSPEDILHLRAQGITAVLNLQSDADFNARAIRWDLLWKFYLKTGFHVVRVEIIDFRPEDLWAKLASAVEALEGLLSEDHKVYLHCTAGLNRSPSVAIAWLMRARGLGVEEATAFFEERRHCVPYPDVLERWARTLT